jgi:hypothetical protein
MPNKRGRKPLTMSHVDLHSPHRQCIELQIEHADLNALIDQLSLHPATDELRIRRLKKRKLVLRDQIARLQQMLEPKEPA